MKPKTKMCSICGDEHPISEYPRGQVYVGNRGDKCRKCRGYKGRNGDFGKGIKTGSSLYQQPKIHPALNEYFRGK